MLRVSETLSAQKYFRQPKHSLNFVNHTLVLEGKQRALRTEGFIQKDAFCSVSL